MTTAYILLGLSIAYLLCVIYWLNNKRLEHKRQVKLWERERLEFEQQLREKYPEQSELIDSIYPTQPVLFIKKGSLDEIRRKKFEEEKKKNIEKRNLENERSRLLGELWRNKDIGIKPQQWYGSENSCPPKSGSCPLMFYCIPAGQSVECSACGKTVQSSSPMF